MVTYVRMVLLYNVACANDRPECEYNVILAAQRAGEYLHDRVRPTTLPAPLARGARLRATDNGCGCSSTLRYPLLNRRLLRGRSGIGRRRRIRLGRGILRGAWELASVL